jgi:UDPglucose--hexose-1-phosphate uridylyltransferase
MIHLDQYPHRRYNPLTREWVLVSPQRETRPWEGQVEKIAAPSGVRYDASCYLCPGNSRACGHRNPPYDTTFVFDNDFPAFSLHATGGDLDLAGLLTAKGERGQCRVVCFSPDHSLTLGRMTADQILPVVEVWTAQFGELLDQPWINYVQIFENRGEMMGCSNPHPHGQIWASETLPNEPAREQESFQGYAATRDSCLLCDYLALERKLGERIVAANDFFTTLVPFWAVWPFEVLLLPNRHVAGLDDLTDAERRGLAGALQGIAARYDNLFTAPFPYSMGFHQHPKTPAGSRFWHLHAHYYPPLLRSASIRKFLVGYEMLAMPQRDITPESAAARLRRC